MKCLRIFLIFFLICFSLELGNKFSKKNLKVISENLEKLITSLFSFPKSNNIINLDRFAYTEDFVNMSQKGSGRCIYYLAFNVGIQANLTKKKDIDELYYERLCNKINLIFVVLNRYELYSLPKFIEQLKFADYKIEISRLYIEYGGIHIPIKEKIIKKFQNVPGFETKYKLAYEKLCKYGLYALNIDKFIVMNFDELCHDESMLPLNSVIKHK